MPVDLVPEAWLQVFDLLRKPLPRPTGKNARSDVTQPDLCTLMRVSKLFNNLTAPILYSTVVSDNIPLLSYRSPFAIKGVQSKAELLKSMRHLYLEYSAKDTPTYESLLRKGKFGRIDPNPTDLASICIEECEEIARTAPKLHSPDNRMVSFSTGVFLGGQTEIWEPFFRVDNDSQEPVLGQRDHAARIAITRLTGSPLVKNICNQVAYGPLSWTGLIWANGYDEPASARSSPSLRHHSHTELDCRRQPFVVGGRSTWYCPLEGVKTFSETDIDGPVARFLKMAGSQVEIRETHFEDLIDAGIVDFETINGSIHVDAFIPSQMLRPEARRNWMIKKMERVGNMAYGHFKVPKSRSEKDVFNLHPIETAPMCGACGWCLDDLSADLKDKKERWWEA